MKTCGSCEFYKHMGAASPGVPESGICHGNPPVLMLLPGQSVDRKAVAQIGPVVPELRLQCMRPILAGSDPACHLWKMALPDSKLAS